ncbi:MAG: helicase-associated domain-containing protein [Caldilineaceae bacterium]|nr:helicase-associated domain-containing protein [Caldilineaceae bacterium]
MTIDIHELLDSYNANTLKSMLAETNLLADRKGGKAPNKAEVIALMTREYFKPERIRASYARLGEVDKEVLNRILLSQSTVSSQLLGRQLVRAGVVQESPEMPKDRYGYGRRRYEGNPSRKNSRIYEDLMARLTLHGLVFSRSSVDMGTRAKHDLDPGEIIFVPYQVRQALPPPTPLPPQKEFKPEQIVSEDPTTILRDLYLYWDFVRGHSVDLVRGGTVGKRSLRAINAALIQSDPKLDDARTETDTPYLHLLRMLLNEVGLLRSTPKGLEITGDPLQAPAFWLQSKDEQIHAYVRAWPDLSPGPDLAGLEEGSVTVARARRLLLATLLKLDPEKWWHAEDLLETMWAQSVDFLYPQHSTIQKLQSRWSSFYFGGQYFYGDASKVLDKIEANETKFLRRCLDGFLYRLGLVELGRGEKQEPEKWQVFRLTERGRRLLPHLDKKNLPTEAAGAEDEGRLIVQPNFHLITIGPVPLAWFAQLDSFADRTQADRGAFEYQISRESIYRALQAGLEVETIQRFLTEASGADLPQNVRRSLDEWAQRHERIIFRSGVDLLQTISPEALTQFSEMRTTASHLDHALTTTVALIKSGERLNLQTALLAHGQMPAVSEIAPKAADNSIAIAEDGTIRAFHALPHLYMSSRLGEVAEPLDDGQWKLTERTIKQSGGTRAKVQRLLDELTALSRDPLSATLLDQIKAWGNYYGNARVDTLTLIEFQSQSILDELLARPQVAEHLTAFSAGARALAVVKGDLNQIETILAQFGIAVRQGIP